MSNIYGDDISKCEKCFLHTHRKHIVPGTGPERADLMIVGEYPGYNEDKEGIPFIGKAGKLLYEMLEDAGIETSEVWLTNVLKCFFKTDPTAKFKKLPPQSCFRTCTKWLVNEITSIGPTVIIALGMEAARVLVGRKFDGIAEIRKTAHPCKVVSPEIAVVATYNPAFALRMAGEGLETFKNTILEDILTAKELLRDLSNTSSMAAVDNLIDPMKSLFSILPGEVPDEQN